MGEAPRLIRANTKPALIKMQTKANNQWVGPSLEEGAGVSTDLSPVNMARVRFSFFLDQIPEDG